MTNPSKNPTENGVENLFTMNVPTAAIPIWSKTVHDDAIKNGHEALFFCKLITFGKMPSRKGTNF